MPVKPKSKKLFVPKKRNLGFQKLGTIRPDKDKDLECSEDSSLSSDNPGLS